MSRLFSNKFSLLALVACVLLIPLAQIQGLVSERETTHRQAIAEMAETGTGSQSLLGPVLVIPCTESYTVETVDAQTHETRRKQEARDCTRYALPERLVVNGSLASDIRHRGIHEALFYLADLTVEARFRVPDRYGSNAGETRVSVGAARIAIGVRDPRGVSNVPSLTLDGRRVDFAPGTGLAALGPGIHAELGELAAGSDITLGLPLRLRGLERLDIVPLGRETSATLVSAWPHPSFVGRFLPTTREVSAQGFEAHWSTSQFATGLADLFAQHVHDGAPHEAVGAVNFGVTLIDPVDLYTQADRAVKYGFLFVALTFVALLGTELVRGLRLHPLQYAMVGVALAVFFLLLLSLAEHLGFGLAYLCASGACVALLAYYLRHSMQSVALGVAYGATLTVLYGLLYGLLRSEDYALLAGSIFVFGVLAALMIATRHLDWYALTASMNGAARQV